MKNSKEEREYFSFFSSFRQQIDLCDEASQLRLYRAITDYALFERDTEFREPMLQIAWLGIKPTLASGWKKYRAGLMGKDVPKPSLRGNKNATKRSENEAETKQKQNNSIVKDSLVKNNIGVIGGTPSPTPPTISDEEKKFMEWMSTAYPHVVKMEQPLTLQQFRQLKEGRSTEVVTAILLEMDNYKPLTRKNRSAYRTALNWLNRKEEKK